MPKPKDRCAARLFPAALRMTLLTGLIALPALPAAAQSIIALPGQTSSIRLSNRDINHVV